MVDCPPEKLSLGLARAFPGASLSYSSSAQWALVPGQPRKADPDLWPGSVSFCAFPLQGAHKPGWILAHGSCPWGWFVPAKWHNHFSLLCWTRASLCLPEHLPFLTKHFYLLSLEMLQNKPRAPLLGGKLFPRDRSSCHSRSPIFIPVPSTVMYANFAN